MDIFDEKDYYEPNKQSLDDDIEGVNKDELFDEKELEYESEKEEPEKQSKGGTKSANDPEPVYFEKFDDALVSDGQGGYTNLGEAVYAKDSGGRTEINELRNLVDNTDGVVHYKGTTTTALSNGSTTNPITIDGEEYTAVFGDIVVYGYTEFVFDGSAWSEFGRPYDTTPTSGSANAVTSDGIATVVKKGTKSNSVVLGNNSTASGSSSVSAGDHTVASGNNSVAFNVVATASGAQSFAANYHSTASGLNSTAFGNYTSANQANMTAIGKFNSPRTEDLFNIGNGTANNARSNILEANSTSVNINGDIQRNGVGIDDYSTTERKIGKWIDGSDLYQRTFEVTASSVNGWNSNVLGTSGIKIVDVQGFMYGLYEGVYVSKPLVYFRNTTDYITFIYDSDVNVYIIDPGVSTSPMPTLTITIKYTKPSAQSNLMQTAPTEEVSETPTVEEQEEVPETPIEDDMR